MNRLMLLTSFSGHVDYETGAVNPDYRKSVERVIEALRKVGGFTVFCAVEHEGWVISNEPPEVGVEKDLAEIDESDVVVALLSSDIISGGIQYEMGYADAKGKKVIAATETGTELAYINQGVANLGHITYVSYEDPISLAEQIKVIE